jgi:hypothetical protein
MSGVFCGRISDMAAPAGATSCITFGVTVSETGMPVAAQRETTPRPQAGPQEQGEEPQKGFKERAPRLQEMAILFYSFRPCALHECLESGLRVPKGDRDADLERG